MTTALALLAFAIPAAAFVLWPLLRPRRGEPASPPADLRGALDADKLVALRALRELALEHAAGHIAEDDYAELRARYEARASVILKRLDALPPPAGAPAAPPPGAGPVPWTRRPLVLAGSALGLVGFGVLLGTLVVRSSQPEPPAAPAAAASEPAPPVAEGERSRSGPIPKPMLEGMLQAAHASLDAGRYQEAIAAYKAVLGREPDNVDAITHLGVILAIAGHAEGALEAFDRALALQPGYPHALWDKARVLYELRQDYAGAIAAWEQFLRVAPPGEDRQRAESRIREARARLAGARP